MKAVILAAGRGSRMGPLTHARSKGMLPVGNKLILEHILSSIVSSGIREVLLVVGYHSEKVMEYFGDGSEFGAVIEYVHQDKQIGTAHAIGIVQNKVEERFLVLNGDILVDALYLKSLIKSKGEAVVTVKEAKNSGNFGVIEINNERVTRITEKPRSPQSNLVNAGIYMFEPSIFDAIRDTPISQRGEYEIIDSVQMLIDQDVFVEYKILENCWLDIGYPWNLLDANEIILSKIKEPDIQGTIEPYVTIKGNVVVGENTVIRSGTYIVGPVLIGKSCVIGPNCFLRAFTSIGDGVYIGNCVEIKNSIVMKDTRIGHLSYIGDSIIGERCNFGAGTKVANLRLDGGNILVNIEGKLIDSGRRKFGAVMGDDVRTGINSMINVGALIDAGAVISPGELCV